jgi:hypothetical protein
VLRWFARAGHLEAADARDMASWDLGGGFSLDASIRIEGPDRAGLERLLRWCARPPFALERLEQGRDDQHGRSARHNGSRVDLAAGRRTDSVISRASIQTVLPTSFFRLGRDCTLGREDTVRAADALRDAAAAVRVACAHPLAAQPIDRPAERRHTLERHPAGGLTIGDCAPAHCSVSAQQRTGSATWSHSERLHVDRFLPVG